MNWIAMMSRSPVLVAALALQLAVAWPSAAAALAQRPGTVVVQVEVTREGQPVEALTADDFQIRDKGKAVPVLDVM